MLLDAVVLHVVVDQLDRGEDRGAVLALVRGLDVRNLLVGLHVGGTREVLLANVADVAELGVGGGQARVLGFQVGFKGKSANKKR